MNEKSFGKALEKIHKIAFETCEDREQATRLLIASMVLYISKNSSSEEFFHLNIESSIKMIRSFPYKDII